MNTDETLRLMGDQVYECNVNNGWFDEGRSFGDDIALLHSEVSEMLEEFRSHTYARGYKGTQGEFVPIAGAPYPEGVKPLGVPSEAADILIRLLDTCKRYNIDLGAEFRAKLAYNATRGHKHGGKAL